MCACYLAWYMECLVNEWINTYTKKKHKQIFCMVYEYGVLLYFKYVKNVMEMHV